MVAATHHRTASAQAVGFACISAPEAALDPVHLEAQALRDPHRGLVAQKFASPRDVAARASDVARRGLSMLDLRPASEDLAKHVQGLVHRDLRPSRDVDRHPVVGRSRRGIFRSLTMAGLEIAEADGVGFVFNTPNPNSKAGYLKMGWSDVTTWPIGLRARRRLRLAAAVARRDLAKGPSAEVAGGGALRPAAEALADPGVARLLELAASPDGFLATPRTPAYLRWRYAQGPIPYHALVIGEPAETLVLMRLRARGGYARRSSARRSRPRARAVRSGPRYGGFRRPPTPTTPWPTSARVATSHCSGPDTSASPARAWRSPRAR